MCGVIWNFIVLTYDFKNSSILVTMILHDCNNYSVLVPKISDCVGGVKTSD